MDRKKLKGIFFVIMAAFGFSLMTVFVRLSGDLPSFEKAFFRNFVALIFSSLLMLKHRTSFMPSKRNAGFIFGRALFGTVGLLCNFYAVDHLVLADANMLNKLSPFFAILFSAFLLKERPKAIQIAGVFAAFCGCLCIVKPGFHNDDIFALIMGVFGGMGAGIAYTFVRKLGSLGEDSTRIIFWFSAFSCVVCLPVTLVDFVPMSPVQLIYLLLAGVFACVGQVGITRAYICAPAKEISVYDYTQVIFAAVLGFVVFGQLPDKLSVLGYFLICGAGVGMFFYNNRKISTTN